VTLSPKNYDAVRRLADRLIGTPGGADLEDALAQ
jgi:hypothetical protein